MEAVARAHHRDLKERALAVLERSDGAVHRQVELRLRLHTDRHTPLPQPGPRACPTAARRTMAALVGYLYRTRSLGGDSTATKRDVALR